MTGTLYILNTLIVPVNFDICEDVHIHMKRISVEEARELVRAAKVESAVGHEATAEFLSALLGVEIPFQRKSVFLQTGDRALHVFLKQRLPEGVVLSRQDLEKLDFWLVLSEVE